MQLHVYKNTEELSQAVAEWIANLIRATLQNSERCSILLSGGNTPKNLYQLLATKKFASAIDWSRIHIFFGDERVVPFEDDRNNGKMANDSLLTKVPIPKNQVHFMDTTKDPSVAAEEYEELLHSYFDSSEFSFDISLLGIGDDGHTLSLFPGTEIIKEQTKWVSSIYLASQEMSRITLTATPVNKSKVVAFLITGSNKATILKKIIEGKKRIYPAQLINPVRGELHWFADISAASQL